jgi:hypothetical protein
MLPDARSGNVENALPDGMDASGMVDNHKGRLIAFCEDQVMFGKRIVEFPAGSGFSPA